MDGARFDLQFAPMQDRAYKSRFADALDVERVLPQVGGWLDDATDDITAGKAGKLRAFLRDVGGETPGGRELFAPLCTLHGIIPHFDSDARNIADAIAVIDSVFETAPANSLRATLVSAAVRHPENLSIRSAEFVLAHFNLVDQNIATEGDSLGVALWKLIPEQFLDSATNSPDVAQLLSKTLNHLDRASLLDTLRDHPSLASPVLNRRTDLLLDPDFWRSSASSQPIDLIKTSRIPLNSILLAILSVGRADVAERIIAEFGVAEILKSLSLIERDVARGEDAGGDLQLWLDICLKDSGAIAVALNCECDLSISILLKIARKSYPDFVPNDIGADPWANAIRRCHGKLERIEQQYFSAYLLSRALGYRSHSQSELIEYSFDEIYFGALHQRLPDNTWQLVDRALPHSWWFDWDRCQRLRDAITEMFVNRDLPPETFPKITRDNALFEQLVELASHNSRGRKYLKRVLRSLKSSAYSDVKVRIIENLLY
jgi:hypothetical protein